MSNPTIREVELRCLESGCCIVKQVHFNSLQYGSYVMATLGPVDDGVIYGWGESEDEALHDLIQVIEYEIV